VCVVGCHGNLGRWPPQGEMCGRRVRARGHESAGAGFITVRSNTIGAWQVRARPRTQGPVRHRQLLVDRSFSPQAEAIGGDRGGKGRGGGAREGWSRCQHLQTRAGIGTRRSGSRGACVCLCLRGVCVCLCLRGVCVCLCLWLPSSSGRLLLEVAVFKPSSPERPAQGSDSLPRPRHAAELGLPLKNDEVTLLSSSPPIHNPEGLPSPALRDGEWDLPPLKND
jgi:hypothetical protein